MNHNHNLQAVVSLTLMDVNERVQFYFDNFSSFGTVICLSETKATVPSPTLR